MKKSIPLLAAAILLAAMAPASAGSAQDQILKHFQQQAGGAFSAARGKALFKARHKGGKPKTPACTSCHGNTPFKTGKTRAGKSIEPMALSRTPNRYSDLKKVEKWFRRNCRSVVGRECSPREKGDYLVFMMSQ